MKLKEFAQTLQDRRFPLEFPGHWINGEWRDAGRGGPPKSSVNPNTAETLIEFSAHKDTVADAIDAAEEGWKSIRELNLGERMEILRRFRQSLADFETPARLALQLEAGKPPWEAQADFDAALRYLEWVANDGDKILDSLLAPAHLGRQGQGFELIPIGVTAAYLPFSTPLTSFVFYFTASVLAGCPLVVSTSSHAALSGILFGGIASELDLPKSLLNIVFGNYASFRQMIGDKRVAAVLYTGSREHCENIRHEVRSQLGRQVVLQSGGKNAVIVHSSADLDQAVSCVARGALTSAGQRCSSTSRVFVYQSLLDEFKEKLVAAFKNMRIGRTDLPSYAEGEEPFMGPLYSDKAIDKFLRFQTMANREASETLLWGKTLETESGGYFVTPGVHYLKQFDNNSAYQGNVLFSPDVAIYDYEVLDDAIDKINTTDAAFSVSFIGDPEIIRDRRTKFLAPNLFVNMPTVELDATLPLAGRLQSGHHRFHGPGVALYLCYPQILLEDEQRAAEFTTPTTTQPDSEE